MIKLFDQLIIGSLLLAMASQVPFIKAYFKLVADKVKSVFN